MAGLQQQQLAVWVWQVAARVSIWGAGHTSTRPVWLALLPILQRNVNSAFVLCAKLVLAPRQCMHNVLRGLWKSLQHLLAHTQAVSLSARDVATARCVGAPCGQTHAPVVPVPCTLHMQPRRLHAFAVQYNGSVKAWLCSLFCAEFRTTRARVSAKDSRASS